MSLLSKASTSGPYPSFNSFMSAKHTIQIEPGG